MSLNIGYGLLMSLNIVYGLLSGPSLMQYLRSAVVQHLYRLTDDVTGTCHKYWHDILRVK